MLAAESQFRRVRGYKQLPAMLAALEGATAGQPGLLDLTGTTPVEMEAPSELPR